MHNQIIIRVFQIIVTGIAIWGTALVFYNSPFASGGTFLFTEAESEQQMARAKKQRQRARAGFLLILVSYVLQTIITFL